MQPSIGGVSRQTWLFGGLLLAGVFVVAWAIVPTLRRRYSFGVAGYAESDPMADSPKRGFTQAGKKVAPGNGFFAGPRQVSLRLTASRPSLHHTALPSAKPVRAFDGMARLTTKRAEVSAHRDAELRDVSAAGEPIFEGVGPAIEQAGEFEAVGPAIEQTAEDMREQASESPALTEPIFESESVGPVIEYSDHAPRQRQPQPPLFIESDFESGVGPVIEQTPETVQPSVPPPIELVEISGGTTVDEYSAMAAKESVEIPEATDMSTPPVPAPPTEFDVEPIEQFGQEYPLPDEEAVTSAQFPVAEARAPGIQAAISAEPEFPQSTTPETMPEPTQTPPAPVTKPPAAPASKPPTAPVTKPQPAATMQTSVQLTFAFEIAAMQLTPSFKMGSLNVRPVSKIVTMRLAPSQQPQPTVNLQVSFEIAKIQPLGNALGTIRMLPSQQRPSVSGSPSVAVTGLQLMSNSEAAPVQLTPSQPGQATVFMTIPCQITTIEFAPSLEIASVVLNSNSKQVRLQLPGAGPGPREGAPTFEITNLQLGDSGDIAMMHLNLVGSGPR
jgi:hypothetical protein